MARHDLLLVAADWQSRALTLAELQEAGYEVMAVPGVRYGVKALIERLVAPPLLLIDIHADEDATPERVEGLLELAPGAPAILVGDVYGQAAWEPLRPRLAALLHRPITVGQVVAAVRRTLPLEQ
jgi:DNA-binding NtrC family response regulator